MTRRILTRRHRSDANAEAVIAAARKLGAIYIPIGRPTDGLVGIGGVWTPCEIKASDGEYTPDQLVFKQLCEAHGLPFMTWRSEADAIAAING